MDLRYTEEQREFQQRVRQFLTQQWDSGWLRDSAKVSQFRLAATERGLPVFEYAPKRIKQATVGTGGAKKNQVAFMTRALLGLTETPDPDSADALAIALTHLRAQESVKIGLPGMEEI